MPHRITRMRIDDTISTANNTTLSGAVAGVAGWAMSVNWVGLLGLLVAVAGFLISWHYQRKRYRLEAESKERERIEHEARMVAIRERCER